MHREVAVLIDRLRHLVAAAEELAAHAEDLHSLAYDRAVSDEPKVSGGGPGDPITGDAHARKVWGRLSQEVRKAEGMLAGFRQVVLNLLNVGHQNTEHRGTLISAADYARALRAQRRRDERGEYTPKRNIDQPRYPGKGER